LRIERLRTELAETRATQTGREQRERELRQQLDDEQARNQQLTAELERARTQLSAQDENRPEKAAPAFVSLLLLAPARRGAETASRTLSIPEGTRDVHIQLKLAENEYQSYRLELQQAGGKQVLNQRSVQPAVTRSGVTFNLSLPASRFTTGDYILTLRGVTRSGELDDVSKFLFHVEKK